MGILIVLGKTKPLTLRERRSLNMPHNISVLGWKIYLKPNFL